MTGTANNPRALMANRYIGGAGAAASVISAQDMERYRQCVSSIEMPINQKDDLINIVHSIMAHFVDQAFGVQTDQITLQSISQSHLQLAFDHAISEDHPENQTDDAKNHGVETDSNLSGAGEA